LIRYAAVILAAQCASTLVTSLAGAQQSSGESLLVAWARAHGTRLTATAVGCKDLDALLQPLANAVSSL
jgi:hypothetical protein